jgi:hypothetical protein
MPNLLQTFRKRLPNRWLTLGEIVGVVAVLLAALGYWDSHRERVAREREHQAELAAQAKKATFLMTADPEHDGATLKLAAVHPEQVIQTQTLWFPTAVRKDKVETTGSPRIEADWIADGVRKAAGKARTGRAPVAVLTVFIQDGETKTDKAVYDVAYSLHPRLLLPDQVRLEGVSLARHVAKDDLQAAADKRWAGK